MDKAYEMTPKILKSIKYNAVTWVLKRYPGQGIEAWDLHCQAEEAVIVLMNKFDPSYNISIYKYLSWNIRNKLRDYIRRYYLKNFHGVPGARRVHTDSGSMTYGMLHNQADIAPRLEAKLSLEKLSAKLDDRGKEMLRMMAKDMDGQAIGDALGITRQAVHKRKRVMRKLLKDM